MSKKLTIKSLRKWISDVNISTSDFEKWLEVKLPDFGEMKKITDVDEQDLAKLNFYANASSMLVVLFLKNRHLLDEDAHHFITTYFWDHILVEWDTWIDDQIYAFGYDQELHFGCELDQLNTYISDDCVFGVHHIIQKHGNVNICFADDGRKTILEKLIEYYTSNSIEYNDYYLLYYLLSYPELHVDGLSENSGTILHYLCSLEGSNEIIQYVLDMYAYPSNPKMDVYRKDEEGRSALMIATEANHIDNVKVLLGYHSKSPTNLILLQDENKERQSPLFMSIRHGHYEIADLLLAAGFDINKEDMHGDTILSHIKRHNLKGLSYLKEKEHEQATREKEITEAHEWLKNKYETLGVPDKDS